MGKLLKYFRLCFIVASISVLAQVTYPQPAGKNKPDFCVSPDEMVLFNKVNELRQKNKLPVIPLSKSLCVVARVHIDDLLSSQSVTNGCSLNSWSNKGNWTSCCDVKDPAGLKCMNLKPKEITGYPGAGYELVYWEEDNASPDAAFDLWQQTSVSKDMILNSGKWQPKNWKAIGVGISKGYAVIWFGDKPDHPVDILLCGTDSLVQSSGRKPPEAAAKPAVEKPVQVAKDLVPEKQEITVEKPAAPVSGPVYYVIIGSAKSEKLAKEAARKAKKAGVSNITILGTPPRFRVSAGMYTDDKSAQARMRELKPAYHDVWLLKQD